MWDNCLQNHFTIFNGEIMKKETAKPNMIENEKKVLKFWNDIECFKKIVEKNKNSKLHYRFLDGPITANNAMGVHHAWNRSLKDILLKYKAMKGFSAHYQNGFDAQGLWVEVETEKQLGLKDKTDIVKFGLANFTEACIERVKKYSSIITEQSKRLGQMMDWEHSYFTNSDENITSIWYFLKLCYEKGWLVEKHRPMPWCSHCGTSLSEHELADSYLDMEHEAVFFKLPIKNSEMSILVWTTTPWTLSSNVAVAVNPEFEYSVCKVKSTDRKLIVCSSCEKVLKDDLVKVEKRVPGSELVGLEYETCFPKLTKQNFAHKIVAWDLVDSTEGSGAVHIAPGCGVEDFELGNSLGLKIISPVDENGVFYDDFDFLAGRNANDVAPLVFEKLKADDKLYYTHKYSHRYPICWRCKKPLIFRLTKEWYIKTDEIRPKLIEACDSVVWQPPFLKKRMLDWLTNMGDWSISRKRFYGLPLPFYPCKKCGELTVVGSLEQLKNLSDAKKVEALPHLHRPYIDDIKIKCPHCGEEVERISEVGDCWLDAGITPFSTKKYFTDRKFWEKNFPAECVIEMKEQIRLWFYSLLFMSVALTGKAPYEKVIGFAMLVAEDGSKFSKSGKNNISFFEAADKIGADVIRYMYAANNMLNDTRFGFGVCDDIRRKLLGLWNAYVFYTTYAVLDKPDVKKKVDLNNLQQNDKWLLSRVNQFVKNSDEFYSTQQFNLIIRDFENLTDDLTNWYIRTNRKRFWKSDNEEDKNNAYYTLYHSLKKIVIAMAPITPFMCEHIWQNLVRGSEENEVQSVLLCDFPKPFEIEENGVIEKTEIIRQVINIAQRLRNETQIKIKQPLKTMYVCASINAENACKEFENTIKEELNIKEIIFSQNQEQFNENYLQVNFKIAGIKLKSEVQNLKKALEECDNMSQLVEMFKQGKVSVGNFIELPSEMFVCCQKAKEDFIIANENGITIVLDITIDTNLMLEGLYRELVRQIQVLRKQAGFKIEQRIALFIEAKDEITNKVIEKFKEQICSEALVNNFGLIDNPTFEADVEIGGETVNIKLKG